MKTPDENTPRMPTMSEVDDAVTRFRFRYQWTGELSHLTDWGDVQPGPIALAMYQMWRDWEAEIEPMLMRLAGFRGEDWRPTG